MSDDSTTEFAADVVVGMGKEMLHAAQRKILPSPLDLVFDRLLPGCVHTGPVYVAGTQHRVKSEWFRVGVHNSGGSIGEVRVQVVRLEPDTLGTIPIQLHRMHDNPQAGQPYERFATVPSSETPVVFFDVVSHIAGAQAFQILHNEQGVEPLFPVDSYEMTLVITGEGVKPRERTFSLALREDRIQFARLR